jgi:hypothetical protein
MALHIDGPESGKLSDAIESAYPNPMLLQQVLGVKLNDNIFNYAGFGAQYPEIRFNALQQYNARYEIDRLVAALLEDNPTNGDLLRFAWRHGILKRPAGADGKHGPEDGSLERMLDPVRGFTDAGAFLRRLGRIVSCVCQISVPTPDGTEYGTGFLIGDETVLTNWHVVEHVTPANRKNVRMLFDYRTGPDGEMLSPGVPFTLVDDDAQWLIDHSVYHQDDLTARSIADNVASMRPADCLDYAVLRVAGQPGKSLLGPQTAPGGQARGSLKLAEASKDDANDFATGKAALFIFQHPFEGDRSLPLQLDWNKPAMLGVNANGTRALYNVNTRGGSSGSPCFNAKLQLIALHHAGGRDWPAPKQYLYNQGIPIARILALLDQRSKLGNIR